MEAKELKRLAGKIVGENNRSPSRMRVYGWPVLIALARHYLDSAGHLDAWRSGHVERTAGALTVAPGGPTEPEQAATKEPPPASGGPGAPLPDAGTDTRTDVEKVRDWTAEALRKDVVEHAAAMSPAQVAILRNVIAGRKPDHGVGAGVAAARVALRRKLMLTGTGDDETATDLARAVIVELDKAD